MKNKNESEAKMSMATVEVIVKGIAYEDSN
jgi:hypothetical protein